MTAEPFPLVPDDKLDDGGWQQTDQWVETVFELPVLTVRGGTLVYGDERTRSAIREITGDDRLWRFFFATQLSFTPPLTPGVGPTSVAPTVRSQAKTVFVEDLRDRGFESITKENSQRMRVDSGKKAKLWKYTANHPLEDQTLPIEAWLAVWHQRGTFLLSGGAYPAKQLDAIFEVGGDATLSRSTGEYRDELLALVRSVEI
jgi:hypothetical protein